jgi:hypothetical protein
LDLSSLHFAPDGAFESWFFKNILQYFFSIFANLQTGWTQAFFTEPFSARRTFPEITIDCFVHLPLSMFHLNCCEHSLMDLHVWSSLMFVIAFILCCWHFSRQLRDRMMHVLNGNGMPKANPKGKGKGKNDMYGAARFNSHEYLNTIREALPEAARLRSQTT